MAPTKLLQYFLKPILLQLSMRFVLSIKHLFLYGILLTMLTSFVCNVHQLVFRICFFVSDGHLKFLDVTIIGAYGRHFIMRFYRTYIGDERIDIMITIKIDKILLEMKEKSNMVYHHLKIKMRCKG